jgi:Ni/Co efflux regulator RcnB
MLMLALAFAIVATQVVFAQEKPAAKKAEPTMEKEVKKTKKEKKAKMGKKTKKGKKGKIADKAAAKDSLKVK